jgi:predicted RNase H-like nuclease
MSSADRPAAVAGVDGCPGGWVVVTTGPERGAPARARVVADLAPVFADARHGRLAIVGIDMPIGLSDAVRACDREARRALGARHVCVFSAPPRSVLGASDPAEARRRCLAVRGRSLTLQTFHLLPRIRELDEALATEPDLAGRVCEVHPELSFAELAGAPIPTSKQRAEGRRRRAELLAPEFAELDAVLDARPVGARADDLLDALAVAWSARRILAGTARTFGGGRDERGLPMCIRA